MSEKDSTRVTGQPAPPTQCAKNTDRELWREIEGDYYSPRLFVTEGGGIGIDVGGYVHVRPIREWHKLAAQPPLTPPSEQAFVDGICGHSDCPCTGGWLHPKLEAQAAPPSLTAPPRPLFTLLHSLWTKAVATPGYDKDPWMELERVVLAAEKAQAAASLTAEELEKALIERNPDLAKGMAGYITRQLCSLPGIKVVRE